MKSISMFVGVYANTYSNVVNKVSLACFLNGTLAMGLKTTRSLPQKNTSYNCLGGD